MAMIDQLIQEATQRQLPAAVAAQPRVGATDWTWKDVLSDAVATIDQNPYVSPWQKLPGGLRTLRSMQTEEAGRAARQDELLKAQQLTEAERSNRANELLQQAQLANQLRIAQIQAAASRYAADSSKSGFTPTAAQAAGITMAKQMEALNNSLWNRVNTIKQEGRQGNLTDEELARATLATVASDYWKQPGIDQLRALGVTPEQVLNQFVLKTTGYGLAEFADRNLKPGQERIFTAPGVADALSALYAIGTQKPSQTATAQDYAYNQALQPFTEGP